MGSGGSSQSRQPKQGCERLGITIHQLQEVDILVQRYQKDWSEASLGCSCWFMLFRLFSL